MPQAEQWSYLLDNPKIMVIMDLNIAIVVTTIFEPTSALLKLADMAKAAGWRLIVVGDKKTPEKFFIEGTHYLSFRNQLDSNWTVAKHLPINHYARKNLGYLDAIASGADRIVETDDDNIPTPTFFHPVDATTLCRVVRNAGWVNVYRLFSDHNIWPRGFPLDQICLPKPAMLDALELMYCPIQQGLADDDPDVDAIYRMVLGTPVVFDRKPPVGLVPGALCPINSQNTAWWPDAYPLMYLPSHCSFRLTDIWRGLIAIRIAGAQDWGVLFRSASVRQERNEHDFMDDFNKELDGYLRSKEVAQILADTILPTGKKEIPEAMILCYKALCEAGVFPDVEIQLLESWLIDCESAQGRVAHG